MLSRAKARKQRSNTYQTPGEIRGLLFCAYTKFMHHILIGENLESALELVENPIERAVMIDEAYVLLTTVALEAVVVEDE